MSLDKSITEMFAGLHQKSPLRKLDPAVKELIFSLLLVYTRASWKTAGTHPADQLRAISIQAAGLAELIRCHILSGPLGSTEPAFGLLFEGLPNELELLSSCLAEIADKTGQAGHGWKVVQSMYLVIVSEVVKQVTDSYHDGEVAQLLQSRMSRGKDVKDAIGKRRLRLRKDYPEVYKAAQQLARRSLKGYLGSQR